MKNKEKEMLNSWLLSAIYAVIGLLFGKGGSFVGATFAGAGHGTGVFYGIVAYPVPGGEYYWPIIGLLTPWTSKLFVRGAICLLLGIKYATFFLDATATAMSNALEIAKTMPYLVVPFLSIYLLVVVFIIRSLLWPRKPQLLNKGTVTTK